MKSQNANLKINEKTLNNDINALNQRVQFLSKENNELKHRLSKLTSVNKTKTSSKSKRIGSQLSRAVSKCEKNYFNAKKHSHMGPSPKMKKVGSDRALLPLNGNTKYGKFGRRETLDVNKSGNLHFFGMHDDQNTRNSDLLNFATSEDDQSLQYHTKVNCSSPHNKLGCKLSRNEKGEMNQTQNSALKYKTGIPNRKCYRANNSSSMNSHTMLSNTEDCS